MRDAIQMFYNAAFEGWVKVVHVQDSSRLGYAKQHGSEPRLMFVGSNEYEVLGAYDWEIYFEDNPRERFVYPDVEFKELFVTEDNIPEGTSISDAIKAMPSWANYSQEHGLI